MDMTRLPKSSTLIMALAAALASGCDALTVSLPTAEVKPLEPLATRFDPAQCGTLTGVVTWSGPVPEAPRFARNVTSRDRDWIGNPHALHVTDGKLANAVVMLEGVDPAQSKSWNHEPVTIELDDRGITVVQGGARRRTGIVQRGDRITIINKSNSILGLRGRSAATFSHMLTPAVPTAMRRLDNAGSIQLTSASGQFWASAELIVSDHPYCTITDRDGAFRFDRVPVGDYTLRVHHPSPLVRSTEIDPESSVVVRQAYGDTFFAKRSIAVGIGSRLSVDMILQHTNTP
jgi:hypothetical protein